MSNLYISEEYTVASKNYTDLASVTVILFFLTTLSFITSSILAIFGAIPIFVAFIVNAISFYVMFTPLHEAVHGSIAGKDKTYTWLNELIGHVTGFFMTSEFRGFRYYHLRHHRHTNDSQHDPEFYFLKSSNPLVGAIKSVFMINYVQLLFLKEIGLNLHQPDKRKMFVDSMSMYLLLLGLWGGLIWFGFMRELLLLWVLPLYLALGTMFFLFAYLPHTESQDDYLNTRVFVFKGPLEKVGDWLMMYQNYHLVHHLLPRIPFFKYKQVFTELESKAREMGTPIVEIGPNSLNQEPSKSSINS